MWLSVPLIWCVLLWCAVNTAVHCSSVQNVKKYKSKWVIFCNTIDAVYLFTRACEIKIFKKKAEGNKIEKEGTNKKYHKIQKQRLIQIQNISWKWMIQSLLLHIGEMRRCVCQKWDEEFSWTVTLSQGGVCLLKNEHLTDLNSLNMFFSWSWICSL